MGFLGRLFGSGKKQAESGDQGALHFYVRCDRCGEGIHIRVNPTYDISDDLESDGNVKILRKEILGSNCQNLMYLHLTMDRSFQITESQTERCTLISREDYEALQQTP